MDSQNEDMEWSEDTPPTVYWDPPNRRGILGASYGRNRGLTFGNVIYAIVYK